MTFPFSVELRFVVIQLSKIVPFGWKARNPPLTRFGQRAALAIKPCSEPIKLSRPVKFLTNPFPTLYTTLMFIGIVGCMGVGKSRLTEALASRLGYRAFFEPVKHNPYLDDFYANGQRWAFEMQIFMLTHRFRQHLDVQDLTKRDIGVVQDQIIYGDVLYGQLTHEFGLMDDRDYANYKAHFETLRPLLLLPDVIVNLETSIDTVIDRIHQRGRESEKNIDRKYLERLTALFAEWTTSVEDKTKVIHLDWTTFQPVDEVVKEIERQLDVQLPLPVIATEPA